MYSFSPAPEDALRPWIERKTCRHDRVATGTSGADQFNDDPLFPPSLLGLRDVAIHTAAWIATDLKALAMTGECVIVM
jgi:hypothetical protein